MGAYNEIPPHRTKSKASTEMPPTSRAGKEAIATVQGYRSLPSPPSRLFTESWTQDQQSPGIYWRAGESTGPYKYPYLNGCGKFYAQSPNLDADQASIHQWTDKWRRTYTHNGLLLSNLKGRHDRYMWRCGSMSKATWEVHIGPKNIMAATKGHHLHLRQKTLWWESYLTSPWRVPSIHPHIQAWEKHLKSTLK